MNPLEQQYVHDVYQRIAPEFSVTRGYLWEGVRAFLGEMTSGSLVLEVGCGNGKNLTLEARRDCCYLGCDFTPEFCRIAAHRGVECQMANALQLPYRSGSADGILCIAVLHHLSSAERRQAAIREMVRVLRPGGRLLLQVWAYEQPASSRRQFVRGDNLVDWRARDATLLGKRFYHVYERGELEQEVERALPRGVRMVKSGYEVGNWLVELQKTERERE